MDRLSWSYTALGERCAVLENEVNKLGKQWFYLPSKISCIWIIWTEMTYSTNVASLVNHSAFQDFNLTTFLYYPIAFALPIWCAFLLNSVNRFLTESWTEKKKRKEKRIIQLNGCLNCFAASALCQPFTKFSSEFKPSTEVLLAELNSVRVWHSILPRTEVGKGYFHSSTGGGATEKQWN